MSIVHDYTCSRARPDPDLLMALRAAGCPVQEIAVRIGHSRASTYRWLVRYGIPRRAVTLLALWEDRKPDIEYIAQHTGSRPSAIRERLITAGALPLPQPRKGYSTGIAVPAEEPVR